MVSQEIGMTPNPHLGFGVLAFARWAWCAGWRAWAPAGGLVAAGGVEGQVAEEFAGGGVERFAAR